MMAQEISPASLTFLEACGNIMLYNGMDNMTKAANRNNILSTVVTILSIDFRDVEPYLVDSLLEIKGSLKLSFGLYDNLFAAGVVQ